MSSYNLQRSLLKLRQFLNLPYKVYIFTGGKFMISTVLRAKEKTTRTITFKNIEKSYLQIFL